MPRSTRTKKQPIKATDTPISSRVLLVEPDQRLASILKRRLIESGITTVDTALTARRMQEQIARRTYRLVVVDMSLNVIPLIPPLKSHGASIVVTTPGVSPSDVRELTAAGADAIVITSHYTPDTMVTFFRNFL